MNIEDLLAKPPKLHEFFSSKATPSGLLKNGELTERWKLSDEELRFIHQHVNAGDLTIETGAGCSTLVFLLNGSNHTAIAPDIGLKHRIEDFSLENKLQGTLSYICLPSEKALPEISGRFKLALIDGRHGFPQPFIDYYYLSSLICCGGYLVVDDLHVWTCEMLCQYLIESECWKLVHESLGGMAFQKIKEGDSNDNYENQPFVWKRSRQKSLKAKFRYLLNLVSRKNWRLLSNTLTLAVRSAANGRFGYRPSGRR